MKDQQPESEDSMEEILSSIRQIISADAGDPKKPATSTAPAKSDPAKLDPVKSDPVKSDPVKSDGGGEEVLVLTEVVKQDGRVVSLNEAKGAAQAQPRESERSEPAAPAPANAEQPTPAKAEQKPMANVNPVESKTTSELVSSDAAKASSRSLSELNDKIAERRADKDVVAEMPMGTGSVKTLEEIVRELMRPMLKDWLDENLPGVVERVVRKEVQKLVRQVDD